MRSSKWHALGNSYLLVEPGDSAPLTADDARSLAAEAATDGVLEVLDADGTTARIAIWNPDGSLAELSGNGTRIAARWLAERTGESDVRILVDGREVHARTRGARLLEQDLGDVVIGPLERVDGIELTPVSVGNPHAVVLGDPADIERVGPSLELNPRFPDRTNVEIVRIDLPGYVTARVWERGVGETSASGTGAVAVAAATQPEGSVVVRFPGGELAVRFEGRRAFLTGPAERLE